MQGCANDLVFINTAAEFDGSDFETIWLEK